MSRNLSSSHVRRANPASDELTCSERQVEDLLSEGESTGEAPQIQKRTLQKASPRRTRPVDIPAHK